MSGRLDSKVKIWTLASDLGLPKSDKPSSTILAFVIRRVRTVAKKFSCANLNDLLVSVAGTVDTVFEEIHTSDDLRKIQARYVKKGETGSRTLTLISQDRRISESRSGECIGRAGNRNSYL
jgi:hypothetical protein